MTSAKSLLLVFIFVLISESYNFLDVEKLYNTINNINTISSKTKDKINLYLKDSFILLFW